MALNGKVDEPQKQLGSILNSAQDPNANNKFAFLRRGSGLGKNFRNKDHKETEPGYSDDFEQMTRTFYKQQLKQNLKG